MVILPRLNPWADAAIPRHSLSRFIGRSPRRSGPGPGSTPTMRTDTTRPEQKEAPTHVELTHDHPGRHRRIRKPRQERGEADPRPAGHGPGGDLLPTF
ncbi:hypothetical protein ACFFX0_08135 [Citricoccus parietis]|uniref:Uncharacterized protein n=1 Tax=Citricoccus parietis TaxID=592307 RepID=A0ABV5FXK7_9MICC